MEKKCVMCGQSDQLLWYELGPCEGDVKCSKCLKNQTWRLMIRLYFPSDWIICPTWHRPFNSKLEKEYKQEYFKFEEKPKLDVNSETINMLRSIPDFKNVVDDAVSQCRNRNIDLNSMLKK